MKFDPIIIGCVVVMVLSFIGMVVCAKKQSSSAIVKPFSIVLMALIVAGAIIILWETGIFGGISDKKVLENEVFYNKAAAFTLGKYLSEKFSGARAVLIIEDKVDNRIHNEQVSSLILGLDNQVTIVSKAIPYPAIKAGTEDEKPEPSPANIPDGLKPSIRTTMKACDFDAIFEKYPDCNLFISLIGLPVDMQEMVIWTATEEDAKKRPHLALLNASIYPLKNALLQDIVAAAVVFSPVAVLDEKTPPSETKMAFDKRYILITPDNVQKIAEQFPNMFQK